MVGDRQIEKEKYHVIYILPFIEIIHFDLAHLSDPPGLAAEDRSLVNGGDYEIHSHKT